MERKKDLGKLIKKRLADAEAEPNDALWGSIEKTLERKHKRRAGILWFWSGLGTLLGVLLLSFLMGTPHTTTDTNERPKDTTIDERPVAPSEKNNTSPPPNTQATENRTEDTNKSTVPRSSSRNNSATNRKRDIPTSTKRESALKNPLPPSGKIKNRNRKNTGDASKIGHTPKNSTYRSSQENVTAIQKRTNAVKDIGTHHTSVFDSLTDKQADSLKTVVKPFQKVKKPKKQEEDIEKKAPKSSKWLLTVHATPNYYTYLSSDTPFNASLSDGKLSGKWSFSYGILINIPLTRKATFRFGYRRSNLKYAITNAVSNLPNSGIAGIFSSEAITRNGLFVPTLLQESITNGEAFDIEQQLGYNELPFELTYAISQNKLSVDAIGGISAMLLDKNSVVLRNATESTVIGSGDYLKKVAYSTSVGIGLRYQLLEKVRLDIEPTLRYQFGTFDNGFKNQHPLIFSISTGATFQF